ncbi:hypothetical protein RYH73_11135 [Olivibacter sp. CPCC 100613]|uniref:hypothetical protein n=1 Tax=Olivibacter sp. CPCC 100613 TaxID=3079931 RepID=UPI002FFC242A
MIKKLGLVNPNDDVDFFRVSSTKYILELSKKSNLVIFYADEIWDGKQTESHYFKSFKLKPNQAAEIGLLIDSLNILPIPSDKFIEDWSQGFDGITYVIEWKKDNQYSFKRYWTPSATINLQEARVLSDFADRQLDNIIDYQVKKKLFEKEIPFYSWRYNGAIITKAISDMKAFRQYKRKKRKQLKDQ